MTVGCVSTFVEVLCQPVQMRCFTLSADIMENDLDSSYGLIPSVDFSRDVLASQPEHLLVIRDAGSVWTDLRNLNRVFEDTHTRKDCSGLARIVQQ